MFTTQELKDVVALYADVFIDDGTLVCDWEMRWGSTQQLPGIRSLHDSIFVKNPVTNAVLARVCASQWNS